MQNTHMIDALLTALGFAIRETPNHGSAFVMDATHKGREVTLWLTALDRRSRPAGLFEPIWLGYYGREDNEMIFDEEYDRLVDYLGQNRQAAPEEAA